MLARVAEQCGIRALAIHGRTRADQYTGQAEYDTIRAVKAAVGIPVIANGDITTPQKARSVLEQSGADGVMIGRAAQGRPWIFREIEHFMATGELLAPPEVSEIHRVCREHVEDLYGFYGVDSGVRIARKHISWYTKGLVGSAAFRHHMNQLPNIEQQMQAVNDFFCQQADQGAHLKYISEEALAA
jgi:tRNA-dihydrouridine synthase B